MTFVKNCKFPVCLLLDNRGLEVMFADHLVRDQDLLDYNFLRSHHGGG